MPDSVPNRGETAGGGDAARKYRRIRIIVGTSLVVVFALVYALVISSYEKGFAEEFTPPTPPAGGVALVFTPTEMQADSRTVTGDMLLFVAPDLADSDGRLKERLEVNLYPTLTKGALVYPAGVRPSPTTVTLPTPGVVQRYPIDTYEVGFAERASLQPVGAAAVNIPSQASLYFQLPGWAFESTTDSASSVAAVNEQVSGSIVRSISTKLIAALLLLLMVVLAVIAVVVVQSTASGHMKLEMNIASWITAMLFALLPIRGFLPGDPPIGSWIDILVFFWVESVIMLCVALTAIGLIVRARGVRLPR